MKHRQGCCNGMNEVIALSNLDDKEPFSPKHSLCDTDFIKMMILIKFTPSVLQYIIYTVYYTGV